MDLQAIVLVAEVELELVEEGPVLTPRGDRGSGHALVAPVGAEPTPVGVDSHLVAELDPVVARIERRGLPRDLQLVVLAVVGPELGLYPVGARAGRAELGRVRRRGEGGSCHAEERGDQSYGEDGKSPSRPSGRRLILLSS